MRERCRSETYENYHRYGGRGIGVCEEWNNFNNFKSDMYESFIKHIKKHGNNNTRLDRIDNNRNYSLDNCRWTTHILNCNNQERSRILKLGNVSMTLSQWARNLGINPTSLSERLGKWSKKKALTTHKLH
jgi:hypothetical protein